MQALLEKADHIVGCHVFKERRGPAPGCGREEFPTAGTVPCQHCATPLATNVAFCPSCGREPRDASVAGMTPPLAGTRSKQSLAESLGAAPALAEGTEIGHRYRVVTLLARGGMGAVYRCRDRELQRDVALKVIRPEIAADAEALDRFKREIQLSSRITHRSVLRVYDLGEAEGVRFLTMQCVDGRDLGSLLEKVGPLPVARLLHVFRQICDGLAAAHEEGVVHRDLKPGNVLVDAADHVWLTDFGLAKTLEGTAVTEPGAVIGTPSYMSPEQVKGEAVDERSDIYSLGAILYEMATGRRPFVGGSVYEVMMRRLSSTPRPVSDLNAAVPPYVGKIAERCLAVDPAARYQSVRDILADLDAARSRTSVRFELGRRRRVLAAGVAIVALAVAGVAWLSSRNRGTPAAAGPARSVLIADFENRTGDPIFDGTLENALGIALEDAAFITSYRRDAARKVAAQLQPGATTLTESLARLVAVREGVSVVTSGIVAAKASGYAVTVKAVDAQTGRTIGTGESDAAGKKGILQAVARVASTLRGALGDTTPESSRLAAAETFSAGSLEAAHEYALAQELQWAGKWDEADRHYRGALELDPDMGRADAGLAAVEHNRGRHREAESYYRQALARIGRMSEREGYRTRGGYYLLMRKADSAIQEFSALVKQYPADSAGIANLAFAYFLKRDMASALREARRAVDSYPRNVPQRNNYGYNASYSGDFETAIREQRTVLELNPTFEGGFVGLALAQLGAGQPDGASVTWKRLAELGPAASSEAATGLADLALYEGRVADAQVILESGIRADLDRKDADAAGRKLAMLAETQLLAGKTAPALATAERARATSKDEFVEVSAARVFAEAGERAKALGVAEELEKALESDPQMYAKVIRAAVERRARRYPEALALLKEAQKLADSWLVHRDLASTYLDAGSFAQADTELDVCLKRRGEATAVFLDEVPSYRLFPPLYYDRGRARAGLKSPAAIEAFQTYLGFLKGDGDPRTADARKRIGGR